VTTQSSTPDDDLPLTPIVRRPIGESALQKIADRVNRYITKSVENIIAAGQELAAAKQKVGHGQFERLFHDHPRHVKDPIRFSARHAQKLMAIANHAVLRQGDHCSLLQNATSTLYQLALLPASTVRRALDDGRIHPEMEARDVKYLSPGSDRPAPPRLNGARSDEAIEREIASTLRTWWQRFPHKHAFIVEEVQALSGAAPATTEEMS
jgi:hypothetical protein